MWEGIRKIFGSGGMEVTEEFKTIFKAFEETNNNYFLTGRAGTGKSTLINYFRDHTKKRVIVLAPTGLAAINVGGQTIHSFFLMPPRLITPEIIDRIKIGSRSYKQMDTIIIDEASMVRADLLDGIDMFLRKHGRDKQLPFGGIQIILSGDLLQLPPVVRREEAEILSKFYDSPYFFSAACFREGGFMKIELSKIFRQDDEEFINLLNQVRSGEISMESLEPLNNRVKNDRSNKAVTLTTTNRVAMEINGSELEKIRGETKIYRANIEGEFPLEEGYMPAEPELRLKRGARVVFLKNGELWVNGTTGTVEELGEENLQVKLDSGEIVEVGAEMWEYVKYEYNKEKDSVEPKILGRLTQVPLKLAWAITVHKSQGMTFERVNIDYSHSPFAHGQTYVALSRCRTLKGITLSKKIYPNDVIVDEQVVRYLES